MSDTIAYEIKNNLYLNITNICTNKCMFCIRSKTEKLNKQYNLWLNKEPEIQEIIEVLKTKDIKSYEEVVFCGFGEPLARINELKTVSLWLKENGAKAIRVDTNGQANIYHQRDITPELKNIVDKISISLNAHNSKTYQEICVSQYGEKAFEEILDFAKKAKQQVNDIQFSLVNLPEVNIEKCRVIADSIGIQLKIRKYYEQDYSGFEN